MPPIDSQALRKAMTAAAERKIPADVLLQQLQKRGFTVEPDTVLRVKEHYRTAKSAAPAESTGAAPTGDVPTIPSNEQIATARAVETMGTGESPTPVAQNPTPMEELKAAGHAAAQAIPGTLGMLGSMAAPELGIAKAAVGPAAKLASKIPGVGGLVAGAIKEVPAIGGAFAGGGAGQAITDILTGSHEIDPERVLHAAQQQAVLQGLGGTASKAVAGTGKLLVRGALKASPKVAETFIKEKGVQVTQAGLDALMEKVGGAGGVTEQIADNATLRGHLHNPGKIAGEAWQEVANVSKDSPEAIKEGRQLFGQTVNFYLSHGQEPLTPRRLLATKQGADDIADPIWQKMLRKEPINARTLVRYRWAKALGDAARRELNMIDWDPLTMSSPMSRANDYTAQLLQLKDALEPVVRKAPTPFQRLTERTAPGLAGAAIGGAITPGGMRERTMGSVAGFGVGAALGTPMVTGGFGKLMNNPGMLQALRMFPQGAQLVGDVNKAKR